MLSMRRTERCCRSRRCLIAAAMPTGLGRPPQRWSGPAAATPPRRFRCPPRPVVGPRVVVQRSVQVGPRQWYAAAEGAGGGGAHAPRRAADPSRVQQALASLGGWSQTPFSSLAVRGGWVPAAEFASLGLIRMSSSPCETRPLPTSEAPLQRSRAALQTVQAAWSLVGFAAAVAAVAAFFCAGTLFFTDAFMPDVPRLCTADVETWGAATVRRCGHLLTLAWNAHGWTSAWAAASVTAGVALTLGAGTCFAQALRARADRIVLEDAQDRS